MEQAMQELLGIISTMPPEQIKDFVMKIFNSIPAESQADLLASMGDRIVEQSAMQQQAVPNTTPEAPARPPVNLDNMF